jgi:Sulfotransferase family
MTGDAQARSVTAEGASGVAAAPTPEETVARLRAEIAAGRFAEARAILERVGLEIMPDSRRLVSEAPAAEPQPRRLVFICGLHRSGTSLLEHHLSARYRVARLRARVPENEGQFLQDVFPLEQPYGGPGHFAFYPQMAWGPLDPAAAAAARTRILATWAPWIDGAGDALVEKSPPNITRIPYLRSVFPGARFVIWTRDPRAVSASTQRWTATALPLLMMHWNAAYMRAIADLEDDCLLESYEAFCADPNATLKRIADFCRLPPRTPRLPVPPRFARVANDNEKYLAKFPRYWNRAKVKAWDLLGYQL